jgi:integrase
MKGAVGRGGDRSREPGPWQPNPFTKGNPGRGVKDLPLPALEPRALDERQVRSLKNVGDRLETFRRLKGRRHTGRRLEGEPPPVHRHARPLRDRAIVFCALSTGLRRAELVGLDLDQLDPTSPAALRATKRARIVRVRGKGGHRAHRLSFG